MIIALVFIAIVVLFFLNGDAKEKAKARKAQEERERREYEKWKLEKEAVLIERESIPTGYGLSFSGNHFKLSEEQITLLRKPTCEYTENDFERYGYFMRNYKNYNVSK